MAYGTLSVDFAGTRREARALVNQYPVLSLSHRTGAEDLPMITALYTSDAQRQEFLDLLKSLGWDEEFVGDKLYIYQRSASGI
jgi:hypothetical protein